MHLQACMNGIGEREHKYFYSFAHRYSSDTCIDPPSSMVNMFYLWLWGISKDFKMFALLGAVSVCCAIWWYKNDVMFEQKYVINSL
jgi:hypothetical protein